MFAAAPGVTACHLVVGQDFDVVPPALTVEMRCGLRSDRDGEQKRKQEGGSLALHQIPPRTKKIRIAGSCRIQRPDRVSGGRARASAGNKYVRLNPPARLHHLLFRSNILFSRNTTMAAPPI